MIDAIRTWIEEALIIVERAGRAIERIADGLDRRNELLEESNQMARVNYADSKAIFEAASRPSGGER